MKRGQAMLNNRLKEVRDALMYGDPTIVEIIVSVSGILVGIFINYPFSDTNTRAISHQMLSIAPGWVWSLVLVMSSFLITVSPRIRSYHNAGVLVSFSVWMFLFLMSMFNLILNNSSSLAPPAYFSLVLFCSWVYLRRTGGIGGTFNTGDDSDIILLSHSRHRINLSRHQKEESPPK